MTLHSVVMICHISLSVKYVLTGVSSMSRSPFSSSSESG